MNAVVQSDFLSCVTVVVILVLKSDSLPLKEDFGDSTIKNMVGSSAFFTVCIGLQLRA
jgi:hypothetical protein